AGRIHLLVGLADRGADLADPRLERTRHRGDAGLGRRDRRLQGFGLRRHQLLHVLRARRRAREHGREVRRLLVEAGAPGGRLLASSRFVLSAASDDTAFNPAAPSATTERSEAVRFANSRPSATAISVASRWLSASVALSAPVCACAAIVIEPKPAAACSAAA